MIIEDLPTLKRFLKEKVKPPIFGVGVFAFYRLGLENLIKDYRILSLRYSLETKLIEKDIEVLSLEKRMGTRHFLEPRNGTTVVAHPRTYTYLKRYKRPILMVYKTSKKMERTAKEHGWILAQSPTKFGKTLFENKVRFRKILSRINVPSPPGEIKIFVHTIKSLREPSTINRFNALFLKFTTLYGLPFVMQHPTKGGGKGTFFIHSKDDFFHALKNIRIRIKSDETEEEEKRKKFEIIIARYIKGSSPSITGCVTRHGILSTNLQHQILDSSLLYNPKKGSGLFCGHDWSSSRFSPKVEDHAHKITERVGFYLKKRGYKGIFGLDFVLDENSEELYVTECNPRFLGSLPTLTMAQLKNNEPPILAFHLLEYLNLDYKMDLAHINSLMRKHKKGAHMMVHNLSERWAKNHNQIPAGIYTLKTKSHGVKKIYELEFIRPGYAIKHLKNKKEFVITEGVPFKKSHFSPNRRLVRILSLRNVLQKPPSGLTPWAERVVKTVYRELKIRPVRFTKFIKLFDPEFLAKG